MGACGCTDSSGTSWPQLVLNDGLHSCLGLVHLVIGQVLGTNIQFELGDIRCAMDAAENCQWVERVGFGREPILLFFCFVLWESRDWHALVSQIWSNCAEGSVLLFCDPKCTLSELSQVLLSLKEGDNCWWLDELTLLVIK